MCIVSGAERGVKLDSINGSLPVGERFYSESLLGYRLYRVYAFFITYCLQMSYMSVIFLLDL